MDWILTNIGGSIMCFTFAYVIIKMTFNSIGKFLCYIDNKKVNHG